MKTVTFLVQLDVGTTADEDALLDDVYANLIGQASRWCKETPTKVEVLVPEDEASPD